MARLKKTPRNPHYSAWFNHCFELEPDRNLCCAYMITMFQRLIVRTQRHEVEL